MPFDSMATTMQQVAVELISACQHSNIAHVQSIVSQYPDAVRCADNQGWTSLHHATACGAHLDVMRALVLADPSVLATKTTNGCSVLHFAAGCPETKAEVIEFLIQQRKFLAQEVDAQRRTALHWVCQGTPRPEGKSHVSLDVVRTVYNAWKEAIHSPDQQGYLPIHLSFLSGAPGSQIRYLAHLDPSSVSVPLPDGRLLVHHLAMDVLEGKPTANPDVLESLLSADPATLYVQDALSGMTLVEQGKDSNTQSAMRFRDVVRKFESRGGGEGMASDFGEEKQMRGDQKMGSKKLDSTSPMVQQESEQSVADKIVLACAEMANPLDQMRQVKSLLDACPDAVRVRDQHGFLPVHWACYHEASVETLRIMLEAWPASVKERATGGLLPLHLACRKGSTWDQVKYLVSLWPESVREATQEGKLPIHYACRHGKSPGLIQFLVEHWPQSLREPSKDSKGSLPIHFLCRGGSSVPIEWMILQDPQLLEIPNQEGDLPLHLLCVNPKTTTDIVKALLDVYPEAATQQNKKGLTPGELASEVNPEISNFLEDALLAKRRRTGGRRPIHKACSDPHVTVEQVRAILSDSPDEVCVPDEERMLPIHLACRSGAPLEVIKVLVEEWPESLKWTNKGGSVPLHTACSNQATPSVIHYLITSWPKATIVANNYGWLPIHCACAYGASPEVISLLVRSNAKSSRMATYGQGDYPLHLACCGSPSLEVIFWLIEASEEGVQLQNAAGELALHKACFNDAPMEVVQFLVEQHPHSLFVEDHNGSTPYKVAVMRKNQPVAEWLRSKEV